MKRPPEQILQFKVALRHISPAVWRRIQVPADYNFWELHVAIQDAMGWRDCHLHVFRIRNPKTREEDSIGIPDDEYDDNPAFPGCEVPVARYFTKPGAAAHYEYDFGDGWEHDVVLEDVLEPERGKKYPRCLAGERACPPEDCGGVPGYERFLKVIADPEDEEHESMLEWAGGEFDPEAFHPKKVRFENPRKRFELAFGGGESEHRRFERGEGRGHKVIDRARPIGEASARRADVSYTCT
jgi:hypothetical protein